MQHVLLSSISLWCSVASGDALHGAHEPADQPVGTCGRVEFGLGRVTLQERHQTGNLLWDGSKHDLNIVRCFVQTGICTSSSFLNLKRIASILLLFMFVYVSTPPYSELRVWWHVTPHGSCLVGGPGGRVSAAKRS